MICIAVPFLFIGGTYVATCVRYQELTNWSIFWDSFKDAFSKTWHENSSTRDAAALLDKVTGTSSPNPSPPESVAEEPSEWGKKVVERSNREEQRRQEKELTGRREEERQAEEKLERAEREKQKQAQEEQARQEAEARRAQEEIERAEGEKQEQAQEQAREQQAQREEAGRAQERERLERENQKWDDLVVAARKLASDYQNAKTAGERQDVVMTSRIPTGTGLEAGVLGLPADGENDPRYQEIVRIVTAIREAVHHNMAPLTLESTNK